MANKKRKQPQHGAFSRSWQPGTQAGRPGRNVPPQPQGASSSKPPAQRQASRPKPAPNFSPSPAQNPPPVRKGGVPPADAFQHVQRRRPPNVSKEEWQRQLALQEQQQQLEKQRRQQAFEQQLARQQEAPPAGEEAPEKPARRLKKQIKQKNGRPGVGVAKGTQPQVAAQPAPAKAKAPQPQKPAKPKKPLTPKQRRRRLRIIGAAGIALLVAAGVYFSVTVFFKIQSFVIEGESQYSEAEIVAAFGGELGDNMYSFTAQQAQENIEQTLPYIETVTVVRRLPSTLVFRVTRAQPRYALVHGDEFALLSTTRKVLEITDEQPEGLTRLSGLIGMDPRPGHPLEAPKAGSTSGEDNAASASQSETAAALPHQGALDEEQAAMSEEMVRYDAMTQLLTALEEAQLPDIDWVDVTNPLDLQFRWQNRITVKMGTRAGLTDKMAAVVKILTDAEEAQVTEGDRGTLDASGYLTTQRVWFAAE